MMYIEQVFFLILERSFHGRISFRSFCFRFLTKFIQNSFGMTTNSAYQASFHGSSRCSCYFDRIQTTPGNSWIFERLFLGPRKCCENSILASTPGKLLEFIY